MGSSSLDGSAATVPVLPGTANYCVAHCEELGPLLANLRYIMHFTVSFFMFHTDFLIVVFDSSVTLSILSPCLCRRLQAL